jgi:hypothetical protein
MEMVDSYAPSDERVAWYRKFPIYIIEVNKEGSHILELPVRICPAQADARIIYLSHQSYLRIFG